MTAHELAFSGYDKSAARWFASQPGWWESHYIGAVDSMSEFLAGDGIEIKGMDVLDVGCGDGIISLGIAERLEANQVLGVDLAPVDLDFLSNISTINGLTAIPSPEKLTFKASEPDLLPAEDDSVDLVTSWSVFEHVFTPKELLVDIHRVLRPGGFMFLQLWPFWYSEHGSHLWPWFDQPFQHLLQTPDQIQEHLTQRIDDPVLAKAMFDLYQSCSQTTIDELQQAILDAGFHIAKVELETSAFHVPAELQRISLAHLGISGIKLLAVAQ